MLLVESVAESASEVRAAPGDARIQVDAVRPQRTCPPIRRSGSCLRRGRSWPTSRQRLWVSERMLALQSAVAERGRGLVVIGGDQTFGLGDYADTPLEEALPVTVQPPEREQVAILALVRGHRPLGEHGGTDTVDRRASRMDLAKEGAILAVETLKEGDQAGVIAFDTNAQLDRRAAAPIRARTTPAPWPTASPPSSRTAGRTSRRPQTGLPRSAASLRRGSSTSSC